MAAEGSGMCLLGAMDDLWFHQIILLSKHTLFLFPQTSQTALPTSESPNYSLEKSSHMSVISDQEISSAASVITCSQVETSSQESSHHVKETSAHEERPTRLNLVSRKTRSHSSSPISAKKHSRNLGCTICSARKLQKTMGLGGLELEEVKGFMDLGFVFEKENLSKRMMSIIPGLRRIEAYKTKEQDSRDNVEDDEEEEEEEDDDEDDDDDREKKGIMRPYLSEAWLMERPDSPLMSLRIPRVCSSSDMKKHLKCWARAVASAILQES